jgi:hypothetical protein
MAAASARRIASGARQGVEIPVRRMAAAARPVAVLGLRPVTWTVSRAIDVAVPGLVDTALRHVDLTELIRRHVDLDALMSDVDVDAIVDRLDLVTRTKALIVDVDLPEVIRSSSGAVASDAVHSFRLQGISGDEAVRRAVTRWGRRRDSATTPDEESR